VARLLAADPAVAVAGVPVDSERETHRYLPERLTDLPGLLAIEGRVFDGRPNQQPWWRQLRTAIALVDLVRHGLEAPVERPGLSDRRSLLARLLRGEDAGSAAALGAAFEYFAPGWVPASAQAPA
jgi:hypothetical protein